MPVSNNIPDDLVGLDMTDIFSDFEAEQIESPCTNINNVRLSMHTCMLKQTSRPAPMFMNCSKCFVEYYNK